MIHEYEENENKNPNNPPLPTVHCKGGFLMHKMDLKTYSKDIHTVKRKSIKIYGSLQIVTASAWKKTVETGEILLPACSGQRLMNIYCIRE